MNYIDEFIVSIKKFIIELDKLIEYLQENKISIINEKEKKHRPLNRINDYIINYPLAINVNDDNEKIKEIKIVFDEKRKMQKKYEKKTYSTTSNKRSFSLYSIIVTDELNRLISKFNDEKNELKSACDLLENLNIDINNKLSLEMMYEIFNDKYILKNRIKFFANEKQIQTIFKKEDYIRAVIFSTPLKDYSMYSLLFENNKYIVCNCYIHVTNSKNQNHFFYGNFEFIEPKINFLNNTKT